MSIKLTPIDKLLLCSGSFGEYFFGFDVFRFYNLRCVCSVCGVFIITLHFFLIRRLYFLKYGKFSYSLNDFLSTVFCVFLF